MIATPFLPQAVQRATKTADITVKGGQDRADWLVSLGVAGGRVSTATAAPTLPTERVHHRYRPVLLVFCCTLIGAIAQILIKIGATDLAHHNAHPGLIGA